jgi:lipopolysaccharide transport system ATP-binding protein
MSDMAIKVENLSKKYIIGSGASGSLRETLSNAWHSTFGGRRTDTEEFWALRDINFEIKKGEAVGIIGRNGAGKSTLLKLLSKITYPTTGKITMNGRVSSLLEVGTGFHPELTGRENIYLNGTILGMSRKEVKAKFDEIVDFSGVEKFLDTPVKRYSSGMYVRLAFAVAAHLEPEILIIDEVLAVGDAEFQKKCLGKMDEVAKGGRTVLFVSHNMGAIQSLCDKGILLKSGIINRIGDVEQVILEYLDNVNQSKKNIEFISDRKGNQNIIFTDLYIEDDYGNIIDEVFTGANVKIVFILKVMYPNQQKVDVGFSIHNDLDDTLIVNYSSYQNVFFNFKDTGYYKIKFYYKNFNLSIGKKNIKGVININKELSDWPNIALGNFSVSMGDFYKSGVLKANKNVPFLIKGNWEKE